MTTANTLATLGNGPAFSAAKSANQTISANTYTKVTFDTVVFDTASNFASSRFTPTVAGYYQINANTANGTTGDNFNVIYKNGSANRFGSYTVNGNGATSHNSALIYMNGTTDYLEIYVYSGGTSILGVATQTYFDGCLVRGA